MIRGQDWGGLHGGLDGGLGTRVFLGGVLLSMQGLS